MSVRLVRGGAILFVLLFVIAVTWPGMVPFNRIEPLILGLPFSMAWIALWVALSFLVLLLVDRVEGEARRASGPGSESHGPPRNSAGPPTGLDAEGDGEGEGP